MNTLEKIITKFNEGETIKDLANEYQMPEKVLRNVLRKAGVKVTRRTRKNTPMPDKVSLVKMYRQLGNITAVGKFYSVHTKTVGKWFDHYGIPYKGKNGMTEEQTADAWFTFLNNDNN